MSLDAIAKRLSPELAGHRVWYGPRLEALRPPASPDADGPLVAVVAVQHLSVRGEIRCEAAPPEGAQVIAVLLLDGEPRGQIVDKLTGPVVAHTRRVFCEQAVLQVVAEGLTIVELAPGVSARDLQARVEPTLLIAPHVKEMVVTSSRVDV